MHCEIVVLPPIVLLIKIESHLVSSYQGHSGSHFEKEHVGFFYYS